MNKWISENIIYIIPVTYWLVAIVTFGHAFNNFDIKYDGRPGKDGSVVLASMVASIAWPLYWSANAFEGSANE